MSIIIKTTSSWEEGFGRCIWAWRVLTFDFLFFVLYARAWKHSWNFCFGHFVEQFACAACGACCACCPPWTAVKDGSDRQIAELLPTRAIQYSCTCAIHYCNCCTPTVVEQLLPTRAIAQISTRFVLQMFEQSKSLNAGVANRLQAT